MNELELKKRALAYLKTDSYDPKEAEYLVRYLWLKPHILGHMLGYRLLVDLHSEWIRYIWERHSEERVIQGHRGSYKTTAVVVIGVIISQFFFPDETILLMRDTDDGAKAIISEISRAYETPQIKFVYNKIYGIPDFNLVEKSALRLKLPTHTRPTKEGSIEAISAGTSKTGRHHDRIHTDDIVVDKDRYSHAKRERTKNDVRELRNILNPGGNLTHSGTPWHQNDAFSIMPKPKKYPIGTVPIKSFIKDLPARIAKLRAETTPSLYAANYELKHIADSDALFTDPIWEAHPEPLQWQPMCHLDAAYGGDDKTALTLMGNYNGKLHAVGKIWSKNVVDLYDTIRDIVTFYKGGTIHTEKNKDGVGGVAKELRERGLIVSEYQESVNKHQKILNHLYKHWKKIYWSHDTDTDYIAQIVEYHEKADHDDAPDSAASLLRITTSSIFFGENTKIIIP